MELNQLKTFITVAEEQHLTRAAERLFTSQPAVSAQLKALEESLGVVLFDRTPKGMKLTPSGEKLLIQAQAALDAANLVVSQAKAIKGEVMGRLSVGVNSDLAFLKLPELLADASQAYPGVQLSFIHSMSPDILLDIRKGKLDTGFFFGSSTTTDLHVLQIADIKTAIVAPKVWEQKIKCASVAELGALPWVYTTERCPFYHLTETMFRDAGVEPSKAVFVDNEESIRQLVKSGLGVALLRLDDAEQAETEGWGACWGGTPPPISLSVAMQQRRVQEPVLQAWVDELSKFWEIPESELLGKKVS
ncbi:LysR family transcriptional regulator [Alkalimarinus coralli]|uniref:LysR family transcriptional regulator n=1 Tax=Alkalimarinus coralli TaxID=2935863 RepID=UPI00202B7342|nr:LysR family transcriptional regulator [Alkalimarinus coralli]